jgi:hypothetical protein
MRIAGMSSLGIGWTLPPGFFFKNVILKCLHVDIAQECDSKGVGSGGSMRGTPDMGTEQKCVAGEDVDFARFIGVRNIRLHRYWRVNRGDQK